ncbi:MAG: hypothetical protein FWF69_01245 [Firmicutes bacterium]|nr:hypothetical protein [Bacillota bacterium]
MRERQSGGFQIALVLVAAIVGAGFASGREVLRFFSVFGVWSWAGCALAALTLAAFAALTATLSDRLHAYDLSTLCRRALGGQAGIVAAWLNGALVAATAGAMIAAMGELMALALPVHHAYTAGVAASLLLSFFLARKGIAAIAVISGWLLPACLFLYALLLREPTVTQKAVPPALPGAWRALPMAFAYAAMNAALACGVLCEVGRKQSRKVVLRSSAIAGGLMLLLLVGANAILYRHADTLKDAALPMVMLARSLGPAGYWLCIVVLSLAVLTTLIAFVRTLNRMLESSLPGRFARLSWPLALLLPLAIGLIGFDTLVGDVYPLLGVASALMFLAILIKPRFT